MNTIQHEESIVWLFPKQRFAYLRETESQTCSFKKKFNLKHFNNRPNSLSNGQPSIFVVAYSTLRDDYVSPTRGWFTRRYWWVKWYDRFEGHGSDSGNNWYETGCPAEAVKTDSIIAGQPSIHWGV